MLSRLPTSTLRPLPTTAPAPMWRDTPAKAGDTGLADFIRTSVKKLFGANYSSGADEAGGPDWKNSSYNYSGDILRNQREIQNLV